MRFLATTVDYSSILRAKTPTLNKIAEGSEIEKGKEVVFASYWNETLNPVKCNVLKLAAAEENSKLEDKLFSQKYSSL